MSTTSLSELDEILSHYNLGLLTRSVLNDRGFVNTSYAITTTGADGVQKTYFLRKYKTGTQEDELIFEHSLIRHLAEKKVCPVADVLLTRTDKTYLTRYDEGESSEPRYYAIFDFLPGEDRYTWIDPRCTPTEIQNSAAVMARFHSALVDFQPQGQRFEPKIIDLLPQILQRVLEIPQHSKGTVFDAYLLDNLDIIRDNLCETAAVLTEPDSQDMPQMPIHCDYHPGNLKFEGDQVTALFDFDWAKVDYRCFDVGLALFYFFTSWEDHDGKFRLEDTALFLKAYQETLMDIQVPSPLDKNELKYLPHMISAANLYVLNWSLIDFYSKTVDPDEYLAYLAHGVAFIRWFTDAGNLQELKDTINRLHLAPIQ